MQPTLNQTYSGWQHVGLLHHLWVSASQEETRWLRSEAARRSLESGRKNGQQGNKHVKTKFEKKNKKGREETRSWIKHREQAPQSVASVASLCTICHAPVARCKRKIGPAAREDAVVGLRLNHFAQQSALAQTRLLLIFCENVVVFCSHRFVFVFFGTNEGFLFRPALTCKSNATVM